MGLGVKVAFGGDATLCFELLRKHVDFACGVEHVHERHRLHEARRDLTPADRAHGEIKKRERERERKVCETATAAEDTAGQAS